MIGNVPDEMTVSASAIHYWHILPDQTLLGRVATMIGSHWAPTSQLTLGSFTGLRGYNSYEFEGQRMLVVNLEHRMFSLLKVWFFKLGTSYFFDSGVVWNEGEGFGGQKFHSSAGVGIQIESGMSAWPSLAFSSASARSQKSTNSRGQFSAEARQYSDGINGRKSAGSCLRHAAVPEKGVPGAGFGWRSSDVQFKLRAISTDLP